MRVLYVEGLFTSQIQVARYLGPNVPIPASSECAAEYVGTTHRSGTALIDPELLHLGENNPETVLEFGWNPLLHVQAWLFWTKATLDGYRHHPPHTVRWFTINCAQTQDLELLRRRMRDDVQVLYGSSRGAATIFCGMALFRFESVRWVVLEGCFDQLRHVFHSYFGTLLGNLVYDVGSYVTRHDPQHASPIDLVEAFPKHVRVSFITSNRDEIVDRERTLALVAALRHAGHTRNGLLILKNSRHEGYATDDRFDKEAYLQFLETERRLVEL